MDTSSVGTRTPGTPLMNGKLIDKPDLFIRWLVLMLCSSQLFMSYYTFDNPAPLHSQLQHYFVSHNITSENQFEYFYNLLYTVYSIPNVVLPFIGGYLVDKFGAGRMNLVFSTLLLVGQMCVALGISWQSKELMLVGRALFGAGAESLTVGSSAILSDWFAGAGLAFALGFNLSISRLGSVVNNLVSPKVASSRNIRAPFWLSVLLLLAGWLGTSVNWRIEAWYNKYDRISKRSQHIDCIHHIDENCASCHHHPRDEGTIDESIPRKSTLQAVMSFPFMYWMLCISCVTVYGTILPYNNIASAFLVERHCRQVFGTSFCCPEGVGHMCKAQKDAISTAASLMSIPFAISGATVPFLGAVIDRFSLRAVLATLAAVILTVVHFLFAETDVAPAGPLVMQGISYSIYAAALWPSVPLVVDPDTTGLAFGLITALQNMGLALFPMIIASLRVAHHSYHAVSIFFVVICIIGTLSGLVLNAMDFATGNRLNGRYCGATAEVHDMGDEAPYTILSGDAHDA